MTEQDFLDYINNFWSIFNPPTTSLPYTTPVYKLTVVTPTMRTATRIINNSSITPALGHVDPRGAGDNANARQNLIDASKGLLVSRSNYGNAPGGKTVVSLQMLGGVKMLADMGNSFSISEIAGGSHEGQGHYNGSCTDINVVNGISVINMSDSLVRAFHSAADSAGATKVLDPINEPIHHNNHFHIQW